MDVPELMRRLAYAEAARRASERGSAEHTAALREIDRLVRLIWEASSGELQIARPQEA